VNHYNVLFPCTGNSARSILAEALLNREAGSGFKAYSAGSHPAGVVRPEALRQLELAGIATEGLQSKSWDEFAAPDAPTMQAADDGALGDQGPGGGEEDSRAG
jgi:arsenate reductase